MDKRVIRNIEFIIATVHVFISTVFEGYIFRIENYSHKPLYILCKCLSVIAIFIGWHCFFSYVSSKNYLFITALLAYFLLMLILLHLTCPGAIGYDTNGMLLAVESMRVSWWFQYTITVIYNISVMIIPSILAPIIILSLIMAVNYAKLFCIVRRKHEGLKAMILTLPFFFPPVLYNNLNPHRMQFFTAIVVFIFLDVLNNYLYEAEITRGKAIKWLALIAYAANMRTEGVVFLFVLCSYIVFKANYFSRKKYLNTTLLILIALTLYLIIGLPQRDYQIKHPMFKANRELPQRVSNIGNILSYDTDAFSKEEIIVMDKVFEYEEAFKGDNVTPYHISNSFAKDFTLSDYDEFTKIYYPILVRNWDKVLLTHVKAFAAASAIPIKGISFLSCSCNYNPSDIEEFFPEASIKSSVVRRKILSGLEGHVYGNADVMLWHRIFSYNLVIPILFIAIYWIRAIKNNKAIENFTLGVVMAVFLIVLVMAPAAHFKYYYIFYLLGNCLMMKSLTTMNSKHITYFFDSWRNGLEKSMNME